MNETNKESIELEVEIPGMIDSIPCSVISSKSP